MLAQLDRAFDYGSRGYGFDSDWRAIFKLIGLKVAQLGRALGLGPGVAGSNPVFPITS